MCFQRELTSKLTGDLTKELTSKLTREFTSKLTKELTSKLTRELRDRNPAPLGIDTSGIETHDSVESKPHHQG